ncbi:TonB-dependent receptor [Chryseolinea sp. T2]|uniref:TonB-dependent receptor n=1 Tax=Chryseolinea sp. T2 TaxID=3129255 RepID=UPI003077BA13
MQNLYNIAGTLFFVMLSTVCFAQISGIKGTIRTSDGQPAEFVNTGLKGTSRGTTTDKNGAFHINNIEPGQYVLVVSFVGLQTKEEPVEIRAGETAVVELVLSENAQQLQEVVISSLPTFKTEEPSPSLRIATSIMETPQSIIGVSSAVIRDQQIYVTTDVARNVSGVTSIYPYVGIYTDFNIRGTRAYNNKLRNGMPIPASYGMLQEDMSYVESVEFIKGPAGFMLAQGEPGGMYNVVTKKPLTSPHAGAAFSMGSYGLFRASVDVGGPVGNKNKLFYRANIMGQNSGTHLDYGVNDRFSFAPSLRYEFNKETSLTLEYNFDLAKANGTFANLPTHDQKFLPRSFAIDDPAMKQVHLNSQFTFINLQHKINDAWKATAQVGYALGKQDGDMFFAGSWVGLIDDNGMMPRGYRYMAVNNRVVAGQIFLNGDVNTGSINHKLLIGFDGGMFEDKWKTADVYGVLPINIYNPEYGLGVGIDTLVDESSLVWDWPSRTIWEAISVQDNLQLTDWLQLTLGGRYTYYQYGYLSSMEDDHVFTPRAGILVQPMENTSVYFLYDQAFVPQTGRTFDGQRFEPMTGNNVELGIKREWFKKRLFTQVAIYNIIKNNVLTSDPQHVGFSIQRGQIKSKGVEVDVTGSVNKNLSVIANYAYTNVKVTKDTDPTVVGSKGQAPVHTINVWAKYKLSSGLLNGLGFAVGGQYYIDQHGWTTKKNTEDPEVLFDYKSLNAALSYSTGNLDLGLNIDNITDEFNFYGGFDYNQGTKGEYDYIALPGTNWRLSAAYKF